MTLRAIPLTLVLLGVAGFVIGAYLSLAHWGAQPLVCGGVGDCGYVNASEYASVGGVPVSVLGAAMYGVMVVTAVAWLLNQRFDWLPIAYWGLALAGAGYAGYLTYVEVAVLQAICAWCVASAAILALSLALASWAVFRPPGP